MIYNQNVYRKERKQSYVEERESQKSLIWHGVMIAFCTFAVHFMLQTLTRSVLMDAVPEFMMPSHFSVLSLYILLALVMYTCYIAKYYNYLTFAEISQNRWYTLVKMDYDPTLMIIMKMVSRVVDILTFYTIGFLATILLTLFLKYPFVSGYFLPLYLCGLIDLLFVSIVTMSCSLFIKEQKNARYIIMIAALCIWILKITSGFYDMMSTREIMNTIFAVGSVIASTYMIYFLLTLVVSAVLILIRAKRIAQYTSFPFYIKDMDMEEDVRIVVLEQDDFQQIKDERYVRKHRNKLMDRLVNIVFTCLIVLGIVMNLFVLFVSLSSPDRETNFFGVIPFVFHTESMSPVIQYNDLAFFLTPEKDQVYEVGDVILYRDAYEPVVSQIMQVSESGYDVDVLQYSDSIKKGYYAHTISEDHIYGIYAGRSRWLGAIILFANTVFGRLLLLLVPVGILYYYKPVIRYLKKKGYLID